MIYHHQRAWGIALFLVVHSYLAPAQERSDIYRVTAGQQAHEVLPAKVKYRYEAFQPGTVSFYSGKTSNGNLNYNILLGDMQFVDRSRDTLSLAEEQTIKQIKISDDTYLYNDKYGFLEVVQAYSQVKLAIHQQFVPISQEKMGAYGQSSGTSAISNYSSVSTSGGAMQPLEQQGDVLISKKATYLLIDKNQRVRRANRSGILRAFRKQKKAIESYIEEQQIDFHQLEDLQKLLQYCSEAAS